MPPTFQNFTVRNYSKMFKSATLKITEQEVFKSFLENCRKTSYPTKLKEVVSISEQLVCPYVKSIEHVRKDLAKKCDTMVVKTEQIACSYVKSIRKLKEITYQKNMAGDAVDESKLKGMSKIFNGQTMRGRANVAIATYASVGLLIAYFSLKPKSKK